MAITKVLIFFLVVLFGNIRLVCSFDEDEIVIFDRERTYVDFSPNVDKDIHSNFSDSDLEVMLEVISTRFSKIRLEPLHYSRTLSTSHRVPAAVANYNCKLNNTHGFPVSDHPDSFLELMLSYELESLVDDNMQPKVPLQNSEFTKLLKLADNANVIFPGTVKRILVINGFGKVQGFQVPNHLNYLKSVLKDVQFGYKMGFQLFYTDNWAGSLIPRILPHIDYLVLWKWQEHESLNTMKTYANRFVASKAKILAQNTTLDVIYSTSWEGNSSTLVEYWKFMTQFAKMHNISMIVQEAFDTYYEKKFRPTLDERGWWKLMGRFNGQLVFEQKSTSLHKTLLLDRDIISIVNKSLLGTPINSTRFFVHLNPYVHRDGKEFRYSSAYVQDLVKIVTSRFPYTTIPAISYLDASVGYIHTQIPKLVANINTKISTIQSNGTSPHLKSILFYNLQAPKYWNDADKNFKISFEVAKRIADEANAIYAGTVKYLFLSDLSLTERNVDKRLKLLQYVRNRTQKEESKLALGIEFKLPAMYFASFLNPVVSLVDAVLLNMEDHEIANHNKLLKDMLQCIKLLRILKPELEVGFRVSYKNQVNDHDSSELIRFWNLMNSFAMLTNTSIVMNEAIDRTPEKNGWWKIVQYPSLDQTSGFVFAEKQTESIFRSGFPMHIAPNASLNESIDADTSTSVSVEIVVVILVGVSLVIVVMMTIICHMHKRVRRTEKLLLTSQELALFFNGQEDTAQVDTSEMTADVFIQLPYQKDLEVKKNSFTLPGNTECLGSGEFGIVGLGTLTQNAKNVSVAVKLAKPNATSLKSLMCEVKVLSYVGQHSNVVELLGAYTSELKKGVFYIFLEYCALGSLYKYLRNMTENDSNNLDTTLRYCNLTKDRNHHSVFLKWCEEIISGMQYLSSKRLVHADLATRNVLLDSNRTAKICDFGLSRRLYDYTSYIKSDYAEPLPWKWMAPESLRHMEFTEKTDVWAFGVTVWEIYSYGSTPYPGLSWTPDFASQLESGLRLEEPRECPSVIFSIMLNCWNVNSLLRPSFTQLQMKFIDLKNESDVLPQQ